MLNAKTSQRTFGFKFTYLQKNEDSYPENLRVTWAKHSCFPAIGGMIVWNYHYKAASSKIPKDFGLAPVPNTGQ